MKTHARGHFLYKSRTGLTVYATLCGATDNLHAHTVENKEGQTDRVTCARCIKSSAFNTTGERNDRNVQ